MVTYDDEMAVVYAPYKSSIKMTTQEHAKAIEHCLSQYFSGEMKEQERKEFENYMEKSFQNEKDTEIVDYKNLLERNVLRRLEIIVATECNLNCRYCYAHAGSYGRESQILSPTLITEYLQNLLIGRYSYVSIVTFFGGEPTLSPSTIEEVCTFFSTKVAEGVFKKMPTFLMVSNGTLINCDIANLIHKYDIKMTISIDGPREINDLLRVDSAGNGTYDKISKGIEMLNQMGSAPILLEATFTSRHQEMGYTKEKIQSFLREQFNVDRVVVEDCCDGGTEEGLAYFEQTSCTNKQCTNIEADWGFQNTFISISKGLFFNGGCDVAFGSMTLMPNGDIYPCHFFTYYPEYRIAFYEKGKFDFTNYDSVLKKFEKTKKTKNPNCIDCWSKPTCNFCPAEFLLNCDESTVETECKMRRNTEKNMILQCAKHSLKKEQSEHIQ